MTAGEVEVGLGKLLGNANVCVNCLGNRLRVTQCIPVAMGICLEGVLCTVGGSEIHVLITLECFKLNKADKML